MIETFAQDVRFSLRLIARHRAFSLVAVGTLAVGISAATALFSVIHAAVLRPLPYPRPAELVNVSVTYKAPDGSEGRIAPSMTDVRAWRSSGRVFQQIGVDRGSDEVIVQLPEPRRLSIKAVSEGFLETLGLGAALGRSFTMEDTRTSSPLVVLLGHGFWHAAFGGDRAVLGRSVRVAGTSATIVGVMPRGVYPEVEMWQPYRRTPEQETQRGSGADVIGRLRTGLDIAAAERELAALAPVLPAEPASAHLGSLYGDLVSGTGTTIVTFVSAVVAILLIACVNVSGLLLARGAMRLPELAVRRSLGAGQSRILRQLLTESLILGIAGGITGVALAWWSIDALVAMMPLDLPDHALASLNADVLGFAIALSLVVSIAAGLLPAWRLSRGSIQTIVAGAGRRHGPSLSRRGGQTLIAVEVALAVVLLVGATLMIRSLAKLLATDVGFDVDQIVAMEVEPVDPNPAVSAAYYPALLDALRGRAGIEIVGAADHWPLGGSLQVAFLKAPTTEEPTTVRAILPGLFEVLGRRPTLGRLPSDVDLRARRPMAVINEAAQRAWFQNRSPLGRSLIFFGVIESPMEIIGVVPDLRHAGPQWPPEPTVYALNSPLGQGPMTIFVRASGVTTALATTLRDTARAVGPAVVVDRIADGETYLLDRLRRPRSRTALLSLLGSIGLVLALAGVFSVTAYAVARRTQEIGVRMAFGAHPNDVVRTMVRDAFGPVAAGLTCGLVASYYATTLIASFLYETTPHDPGALAAAAVTLGTTALLAAWIPAQRAARVDPVQALRAE